MPGQKSPCSVRNLRSFFVFVFVAAGSVMTASADVTFSGIQNIVLQGVPNSDQALNIELKGIASSTDTLNLIIDDFPSFGDPFDGSNTVIPGTADVGLALGSAPLADPLQFGDPYPSNPQFGSGSILLYGFGFGPHDGDFYYPLESETSSLTGWIQLVIQNSNAANESITVVDWAVSDTPGVTLAMGEVGAVPEPSSWLLTASAIALGFLARLRRRGPRHVAHSVAL